MLDTDEIQAGAEQKPMIGPGRDVVGTHPALITTQTRSRPRLYLSQRSVRAHISRPAAATCAVSIST